MSRGKVAKDLAVQAAQAEVALQMRQAAYSSPQDNRQLERQQVSHPSFSSTAHVHQLMLPADMDCCGFMS